MAVNTPDFAMPLTIHVTISFKKISLFTNTKLKYFQCKRTDRKKKNKLLTTT